MEVIPAIDLRQGRCVRLVQGDLRDETVYSQEPVSMAKLWKLKGARWLHVIDLDGAFTGRPQNMEHVRDIISATGLSVQMGGGIRDLKTVERVLKIGVKRVILGTQVVQNKSFVQEAVRAFPKAIWVGVDAKKGWVAIKGWKIVTKIQAVELAREMEGFGVEGLIFTDIQKDGMLKGPNVQSTREIARAVKIPVIASGGITRLRDIERFRRLERLGVRAVVIGKALYSGALDLKDAVRAAAAAPAAPSKAAGKSKKK